MNRKALGGLQTTRKYVKQREDDLQGHRKSNERSYRKINYKLGKAANDVASVTAYYGGISELPVTARDYGMDENTGMCPSPALPFSSNSVLSEENICLLL